MVDSRTPSVSVWHVRPGFLLALVIVPLLLIIALVILGMQGVSHPAPRAMILSNLRQISLAKQAWASDHHVTNDAMISENELGAYFGTYHESNGLVKSAAGELYVIGSLQKPVEAKLTCDLGQLPKGTIIWNGTNGFETILPDKK